MNITIIGRVNEMALKSHGITEKTPENLLFSAGAIYKNLKYEEETTNIVNRSDSILKGFKPKIDYKKAVR